MHLEVTFKHLKPKEEIRRRGQALFTKLERFLDPASEAHLVVEKDHGVMSTELIVTTRGHTFAATDESEDLRTALDRTFHVIEKSLRRAKEKRVKGWQKGPGREDGFVEGEEGEGEIEA